MDSVGADGPKALRKTVLAGAIGNVLEWYDFALFGLGIFEGF